MKKILLLLFVFAKACIGLHAQPYMHTCDSPLKFSDVVAEYQKYFEENNPEEWNNNDEWDGIRCKFERWKWKMQQQIDENGYIVPFSKTVEHWQKYIANHHHSASRTTTTTSNWILQGPNVSASSNAYIGRINVVAFDPVDSNTFYAGSPAGSTWKTTDGGHSWVPLYDKLPSLGVSDIKINPLNRNTIYVVTGDVDNFDTYSSGVIASHDGGATWTNITSIPGFPTIASSLLINPLDTNSMMFATFLGLYKTYNGGISWINVNTHYFTQLIYNPADTNIVYGAIYGFVYASGQIMRSKDGGATWDSVTKFKDITRISMAVSPGYPAIVKAIAGSNIYGFKGIYNSSDSGQTFVPIDTGSISCTNNLLGWEPSLPTTSCDNQCGYDLCIAINPVNPNQVVIGGVYTFYSSDVGATWQIANIPDSITLSGVAHVHQDKHCLAYNPLTGALFEGSDGGIHKTWSPLTGAWTDLTDGICVTEFYSNAVDNGVPFCLGGSQDNGTVLLNGSIVTNLMGGDGFYTYINYGDPGHIFYTSNQNGVFITRDGGVTYKKISDTLLPYFSARLPVFALHPHDTGTLLLGSNQQVFASYNNGISWAPISPVLDTSPYTNINIVKIAISNPDYLYVVQNFGIKVIHYSKNFGASWDTISWSVPIAMNYISNLVVDPKNEKHFWVTIRGNTSYKVFSYDLQTNIWTDESGTLPNISINCMVVDSFSGTLYIGTQTGVFYKTNAMSDWALYDNNLPAVSVNDLNINYTTGEIWAATYGRGMWRSIKNDLPNGVPLQKLNPGVISVLPNPSHDKIYIAATNLSGEYADISITDITGRVLLFKKTENKTGNISTPFDIKSLSPGMYFVTVKTEMQQYITKIVKE